MDARRILWLAALVLFCGLAGCSNDAAGIRQGYVEGEFVNLAPALAGRLEVLDVARGDAVRAGQRLFALESGYESAAVAEAENELAAAENDLADLEKGRRPTELASIRARLAQAASALSLARTEYERRRALFREKTISEEELDRAESDFEQKAQGVREISSELKTAELGARSDEIKAAGSRVEAARAKLAQARWGLAQKINDAPRDALVFDTLYRPGEWVPAGRPVVQLLPPENILVRFFVPETEVGALRVGQAVRVLVDGRDDPVRARISFISPKAEFTPPVIYSSQSRAKLVFMVQARPDPDAAAGLHPGQPVDVVVAPQEPRDAGQ
ncbi:MAG: HlyD family efflux transporter periplasmic adaptor subunit [Desulfovibrionaceae bacterium]|nr:HlyD family efflux transporter periplasmic adaptor subunit [Desulfovibrionaceae bacterium]